MENFWKKSDICYVSGVKIRGWNTIDVSNHYGVDKSHVDGHYFAKSQKINIETWKIQIFAKKVIIWVANRFNSFAYSIILNLLSGAIERMAELHSKLEKTKSVFDWSFNQFESAWMNEEKLMNMLVMTSSETRKNPTYLNVMHEWNLSKRQAWKLRSMILKSYH